MVDGVFLAKHRFDHFADHGGDFFGRRFVQFFLLLCLAELGVAAGACVGVGQSGIPSRLDLVTNTLCISELLPAKVKVPLAVVCPALFAVEVVLGIGRSRPIGRVIRLSQLGIGGGFVCCGLVTGGGCLVQSDLGLVNGGLFFGHLIFHLSQ